MTEKQSHRISIDNPMRKFAIVESRHKDNKLAINMDEIVSVSQRPHDKFCTITFRSGEEVEIMGVLSNVLSTLSEFGASEQNKLQDYIEENL